MNAIIEQMRQEHDVWHAKQAGARKQHEAEMKANNRRDTMLIVSLGVGAVIAGGACAALVFYLTGLLH